MNGMDATVLTLVLHPGSDYPPDPNTNKPVIRAKDRVDFLLQTLQDASQRIVIPTPVLSEVLVRSGASGLAYVQIMQKAEVFDIRPFDEVAAIELAEINRKAIEDGEKSFKGEPPYQKVKLDRQIVAICKIAGVRTLYASDPSLANFARRAGITVKGVHELPLPSGPQKLAQMDMFTARADLIEDEPDLEEIEADDD
jgi:predicted nucleic acid-binding protein